jgi:LysM repeat protein
MKKALRVFTLIALFILVASLTIVGKSEAAKKEYVVQKGDMLSAIGARHKMPWQKIYEANRDVVTHPKKWVFPGQKLVIPGIDIAEKEKPSEKPVESKKKPEPEKVTQKAPWPWKNHRGNPYYQPAGGEIPIKKAQQGIMSFKLMPEPVKRLLISEMKKKNFTWARLEIGDRREEMLSGGGIKENIIVATKNEGTRRYQVRYDGKIWILDDPIVCHNLTWTVVKAETAYVPPPFKPPPMVKLYSQPLQAFIEVVYRQATCRDCQLDLSVGGQWQDYSDGAEDYTDWLYAAVRCHMWTDKYGNKHKPGAFVNGSRFDGNWKDVFYFEGEIKTFGVEHRIETPNGQELVFRIGLMDQKETGSSTDTWGTYRRESENKAMIFEIVIEDYSRINENWFPFFKSGIALVTAISSERNATWTNADTGEVTNIAEKPYKISAFEIKGEVDWWQSDRKLVTFSTEFWSSLRFNGDTVSKITPFLGILGNSIKFGYQVTGRNTNGSHATGTGLAWQIHLYDLYRYMEAKRWQRPTGTGSFSDPNAALNVAISSAADASGQTVNPFANPNKALSLD